MAISVVQGIGAGSSTATLAATFATPLTSANAGDLLIAVCSGGTSITYTTPSGWAILSPLATTSYTSSIVYYKIASGSETGISVTLSAAGTSGIMLLQVTGAASSAPTATTTTQAGSSASITFGSQTPTLAGSAIFEFAACNSNVNTVATPSGYTAVAHATVNYHTVFGFYDLTTSVGTNGAVATTQTNGAPWNSVSVLVAPGAARRRVSASFILAP